MTCRRIVGPMRTVASWAPASKHQLLAATMTRKAQRDRYQQIADVEPYIVSTFAVHLPAPTDLMQAKQQAVQHC